MTTMFSRMAIHIKGGGYSPVPIDPVTGHGLRGWDQLRDRPLPDGEIAALGRKNAHYQLAVVGGYNGLVPIDVDTDDEEIHNAVFAALGHPVVARKGSKGFVGFWRDPTMSIGGKNFADANGELIVEIKARSHVTIPPSTHRKTGKPYRWLTEKTLLNTRVQDLGIVTQGHIVALAAKLSPWCPCKLTVVPTVPPQQTAASGQKNSPSGERRMQAFADKVFGRVVAELNTCTASRNHALFKAASTLGKFEHHGIFAKGKIETALVDAAKTNGYLAKEGMKQVVDTINSGIRAARNDNLPVLEDRPRQGFRPQYYRPEARA